MNDFIIGAYYLIIFIFPLYKILKDNQLLNEKSNEEYLRPLIKRVVIWCIIALITTMISTVIAATFNALGGIVYAIDAIVNSIAIVAQFGIIKTNVLPTKDNHIQDTNRVNVELEVVEEATNTDKY